MQISYLQHYPEKDQTPAGETKTGTPKQNEESRHTVYFDVEFIRTKVIWSSKR